MRSWWRRGVGLAATALVSAQLTGCDTGTRDGSAALRIETITTLDVGTVNVFSVVVSDGRTAWTAGDARGGLPHKVMLLEGQQARELARTQYETGHISRVRLSGRWAVFVDAASDTGPWQLLALDVGNGERVVVAQSATADGPPPPAPSVDGDVVVWGEIGTGAAGRHRIVAHDLVAGTARVLAEARAEQLAAGGRKAYFDDDSEAGRDVYAVPLDGSTPPTQVSHSGQAAQPAASAHGVAWVEPPAGDSTAIVVSRPRHGQETLATGRVGSPAGHNPRVCDGFGLWDPLDGLYARPFGNGAEPLLVAPKSTLNGTARWWCDGTRIAWATFVDETGLSSGVVVHVARVRLGEADDA